MSTEKVTRNLEVDDYVFLEAFLRTIALETVSRVALRDCSREVRENWDTEEVLLKK